MKAFINHLAFEFKSGIRDKTQLLMNYLVPLLFYFMVGGIMTGINPLYNKIILPSMITFSILMSTLLGMPNPIVASRESGVYRNYKINGVPAGYLIIIPALTTLIHMIIVGAIITITAPIIFKGELPTNWGFFIFCFLVIMFSCMGIGTLIGVCSQNGKTSVLLAQLIFLPSMLIGGVMIPLESLPSSNFMKLSKIIPSTYAMNIFQGAFQNQQYSFNGAASIMILIIGGITAFGLSTYLFTWDKKNANNRNPLLGLLAIIPYVVGAILL